jgi:hypothetical protein
VNRLRDFIWSVGDRVVVDGGELVRRLGPAISWPFRRLAWALEPFRRLAWALQDRLIWPIADRAGGRRATAVGLLAAVTGAGVVAALALSSPDGSNFVTKAEAPPAKSPIARVAPAPEAQPEPTLHGATPVFTPAAKHPPAQADSPKGDAPASGDSAAPSSSPPSSSSSPATDKISSTPSAPTAPTARASSIPPVPAGPKAIAVAHDFADAFVVYETGGVEPTVRETFGRTASPRLSRALLRRPPRLPADVEVPKAKVMNVVAAPSRGPIYPVSVSLLRLGVTSELRLSMERRKNDEWRVTDVLG